jgi:cold-inducible RNA-binding protein
MGRNLYVGNLAYGATEEQLRELFEQFGGVDTINVISDRETGRSRGFAFVKMITQEDAARAIDSLNGHTFMNRVLVVDEARPRTEAVGVRAEAVSGRAEVQGDRQRLTQLQE